MKFKSCRYQHFLILIVALSTSATCNDIKSCTNIKNIIPPTSISDNSKTTDLRLTKSEFQKEKGESRNERSLGNYGIERPLPLPSEVFDGLFSRRLFNSTMNYIVPIFEVSLPMHTDSGSTVHLAMQAFLGLFSAIAWVATVGIPLILTELVPFGIRKKGQRSRGLDDGGFVEYTLTSGKLTSLFNDKIKKQVGLEWDICFAKTICEAHRQPKKYGIVALPFLIYYPPPTQSESHLSRSSSNSTQFQKAADVGASSSQACGQIYHCFFDVLDLAQYLIQNKL